MPAVALGDDIVAFDGATVEIYHIFSSVHRCLLGGWPSGLLRRL